MLFTGSVDRARNVLPSPNELKRKILIKARKLKSAGDGGVAGAAPFSLNRKRITKNVKRFG